MNHCSIAWGNVAKEEKGGGGCEHWGCNDRRRWDVEKSTQKGRCKEEKGESHGKS